MSGSTLPVGSSASRRSGCATTARAIAARWADLPSDLAITLETDRLMTLGQSDGEAQIAIKRRFFGD